MAGLINIGFGNYVNGEKLIAVINPDAAPIRRLIQGARETQKCVDATQGRKTKAVLVMEPDIIVLSALIPETITRRWHSKGAGGSEALVAEPESTIPLQE